LSFIKPQFIYFDLDDTLLNHKKAEQNGLLDVYDHFAEMKKVSSNDLLQTYHTINSGLWLEYGEGRIDRHQLHRRRFEETFIELGIPADLYQEAGKVYMSYYRNHWEWIEGAKKAYETVAGKYPTGIITNGFAETQRLKIEQFGFKHTARHIVISEEVGVMKPQPGIFNYAAKLCRFSKDEILYVGDSYSSDVEGGKAAGWRVAWYNSKHNGETSAADLTFTDFNELMNWLSL
jgi:putative hydrolase of the HAD superfamily